MRVGKVKELISILKESSLYATLSTSEKEALVANLAEQYPSLVEDEDEDIHVGYESSWQGIIKDQVP